MKKNWSREESKERFPLPISPLGWSLLVAPTQSTLNALSDQLGLRTISTDQMIKRIDCYVYARKGFFRSGFLRFFRPTESLKFIGQLAYYFLKSFLISSDKPKLHSSFMDLIFENLLAPKVDSMIYNWKSIEQDLIPKMRTIKSGNPGEPIDSEEFLGLKKTMELNSCRFFYHDFEVYFLKNLLLKWLEAILKKKGISHQESVEIISRLTQGLSGNFAIQMALDQNSLDPKEWTKKYGHLTDNWDLSAPTLQESSISNIATQTKKDLSKLQGHQESIRKETEAKLLGLFGDNPALLRTIRMFQQVLLIDEDMRAYSSLQYPEIRKLFRRVAVTAQISHEDIYFLNIEEIESALLQKNFSSYFQTIQQRRDEFHKALLENPPLEYKQTAESVFEAVTQVETTINSPRILQKGIAVSPGQAQGPALVVRSMDDLKSFTIHHILVLRSATPTYSSFYSQCSGVISETGGLLSHGALVAREFQIPMIADAAGALDVIKTGDMIRLDATKGHYSILE